MRNTLITIATYNEIDNLPLLVDAIFQFVPEAHVLAIDDNSPDGTGRWCDERARLDARVHCLHRKKKLGLGTAIIAGLEYAIEHHYDFALNMDADFSHHPRYLPDLIAGMDPSGGPAVDVMIGSRYVPQGGVEGWPLRRRLMSKGVNFYSRWLLGLKPRDCSGGYRCYRTSLVKKLDLDTIHSKGYSFQEEILWRLKLLGARFGETPIVFADRERGHSKINGKEALAALRIIAGLGVKNLFAKPAAPSIQTFAKTAPSHSGRGPG